jgi:hypothetical protein
MSTAKTLPTAVDPASWIAGLPTARQREEGAELDALFRRATGWTPAMWGPSIVGYGRYDYTYPTGRSGTMAATGFSPRKPDHVLYVVTGYSAHAPTLERLGHHRIGKSCLYLRTIRGLDLSALEDLIRQGLNDLRQHYPVFAA